MSSSFCPACEDQWVAMPIPWQSFFPGVYEKMILIREAGPIPTRVNLRFFFLGMKVLFWKDYRNISSLIIISPVSTVYSFLQIFDWSLGISDSFDMRKDNEFFAKQALSPNEHFFFFHYKLSYIKSFQSVYIKSQLLLGYSKLKKVMFCFKRLMPSPYFLSKISLCHKWCETNSPL